MMLRPLAFLVLLVTVPKIPAEESKPKDLGVEYARNVLVEEGIGTKPEKLLEYIRQHTHTEEMLRELEQRIEQLGHEDFEIREKASNRLRQMGRQALVALEKALASEDAEVVIRARRCIDHIRLDLEPTLVAAAALVLSELRPTGTIRALLDYLPSCEEAYVEDSVFDALSHIASADPTSTPILVKALESEHPVQRAAVVRALGSMKNEALTKSLVPILKDKATKPRLEAALALLRLKKRVAITALIALIEEGTQEEAWLCEETLMRLAGTESPDTFLGEADDKARQAVRLAWSAWAKENADSIDLTKFSLTPPVLGLTLTTEYDGTDVQGRVGEWGRDGKLRWSFGGLRGVNDVQRLPGSRVLVAERNARQVTERTRTGKILWKYSTSANAVACARRPNGNTLVTTYQGIDEVSKAGKVVRTFRTGDRIRHSVLLRNGHVLYIGAPGIVIELNTQFREVRRIAPVKYPNGGGYWAGVEPLPRGRFLVTLGASGKVIEMDSRGKILWECNIGHPVYAQRLTNGNTLISQFEEKCLVEVDRHGNIVKKLQLKGRPFTFRRY